MKEKIKKAIILIVVIAVIYFGYNLFFKKDKWEGVYYPYGCLVCEENYIFSQPFETKEQCLNWAEGIKTGRNNPSDLYECGKNCKWKDGLMVCKETVD